MAHDSPPSPGWYPDPPRPQTTPDGVPLAGYGRRIAASVIDIVLVGGITLAAQIPFLVPYVRAVMDMVADPGVQPDPERMQLLQLFALLGSVVGKALGLLLGMLNDVLLTRYRRGSVGKLLLGLRVRPWADDPAALHWSLVWKRWLTGDMAAVIVGGYVIFDGIVALLDVRRQALHDKWPGTVVVAGSRKELAAPR